MSKPHEIHYNLINSDQSRCVQLHITAGGKIKAIMTVLRHDNKFVPVEYTLQLSDGMAIELAGMLMTAPSRNRSRDKNALV